MNTKIDRVFNALVVKRQELTAKQIAARYNVANPYDAIYRIRQEGYAIYLTERVDSKGRVTQKYSYGAPSNFLVAAGYKAIAAGLV